MLRLCRSVVPLVAFLLLGSAAGAAPRAHHVVIVSFDGGAPAVLRGSRMPTLRQMARDGAATWSARTVLPSITLVAHASMLTGVNPRKHGIDWNDWLPERGLVRVPTIFALARRTGLTTALFAGKEKFRHLLLPGSLGVFSVPSYSAGVVAASAAAHILAEKPGLCFVHFAGGDGAGHAFGWGSLQQRAAFADGDRALGMLRQAVESAGIARSTVFLITADHGGHGSTHGSALLADTEIPWIAWGVGVRPGQAIEGPVSVCDTAATALWLLGVPIPEGMDGRPVVRAFANAQGTAPTRRTAGAKARRGTR